MRLTALRVSRWTLFGLVAVVVAVGASAVAQKSAAGQTETKVEQVAAPVEMVVDSEKAARTREHIERMRDVLTAVLKFLEQAREERDVVKLNCVNEKLTSIKGLLKISEQADVSMQEALARRDGETAAHEFEKIAIARNKVEQLMAESESCVGELAVYSGDTSVEVVMGDVPQADPTRDIVPPVDVVVRPPAASPFQ